jgi:tRNA nucleotidyltransferase (CCA-adding enzyme)
LIENAVKMDFFKRLSGRRVFSELKQILGEENPTSSIVRLNDYGLLKVIHPSLILNKELISSLNSAKKVLSWHDLLFLEESYMKWAVYFMVLFRHCEVDVSKEICDRFEIIPKYQEIFCKERFEAERSLYRLETDHKINNVELYKELSVFRIELILYMMAVTRHERAKKAISFFITQLRQIKISVSGKDLKEMKIEPGPLYRKILQAVLDEKLNGQLKTKNDELNFVRDYASRS